MKTPYGPGSCAGSLQVGVLRIPGTPSMIRDFDKKSRYSQLVAKLARVVAPGIPYRVTQREYRRQQAFLSTECSDTVSEALRRHGRTGRALADDDFISRPASTLGRSVRRQKPGREGSTNAHARYVWCPRNSALKCLKDGKMSAWHSGKPWRNT